MPCFCSFHLGSLYRKASAEAHHRKSLRTGSNSFQTGDRPEGIHFWDGMSLHFSDVSSSMILPGAKIETLWKPSESLRIPWNPLESLKIPWLSHHFYPVFPVQCPMPIGPPVFSWAIRPRDADDWPGWMDGWMHLCMYVCNVV